MKAETRARDLARGLVEVPREDADRRAKALAAGRKPPARAVVSAALPGSVSDAVVNGADRPGLVVRRPKETPAS